MILVLADDMTGALEVGAVFASSGFRSIVTTRLASGLEPDVLVVDTETRHSSPSAAYEVLVQVVRASSIPPEIIYKKTDSTLRGNIRSDLTALAVMFPDWRIGYAPAYPKQGRTVRDGVLFVHGLPVSATDFACDDLNPVLTSSIYEVLGSQTLCTVFDGTSDLDVENAARTILSDNTMRIAAGPTALAAALARQLQPQDTFQSHLPSVETCIVLNGSRTDVSLLQTRHAEQYGCLGRSIASSWRLVDPSFQPGCEAPVVASIRANHVLDLLREQSPDAVLLIGGDTAYAFVSALRDPPLSPVAEILPGVAISRIHNADLQSRLPGFEGDLFMITKAGGFGEVDVLCQIRRILEQSAG